MADTINRGDVVQLNTTSRGTVINGGYGSWGYNGSSNGDRDFEAGVRGTVTRVYSHRIYVHIPSEAGTWSFDRDVLNVVDSNGRVENPNAVPEGMIDPNDPRLMWFWDKVGMYAEGKRWCSDYDYLLRHFGLPARPTMYTVNVNRNGVTLSANIMARSRAEAQEKLNQAMGVPDPVAAESS